MVFFAVSNTTVSTPGVDAINFTRAGAFTADDQGFLRNSSGYYLQGWPVAADGSVNANPSDLSQLDAINIDQLGGTAEPTTQVKVNANLLSSEVVNANIASYDSLGAGAGGLNMASYDVIAGTGIEPDFQRSIQVFDSKGGFRTITMSMLKKDPTTNPNEWFVEFHATPASEVAYGGGGGLVDGQVAVGSLVFGPDGQLDVTASTLNGTALDSAGDIIMIGDSATGAGAGLYDVAWAVELGIDAQDIVIDLGGNAGTGGITQFDSAYNLASTQVNGAVFGNLSGVEVDEQGFLIALFDNGIQRQIYQIPVATFVNPNGLLAVSGNAYGVTNDSGTFNLKIPGTGGSGLIASGSLEASTVDLASEFTGLITTQRAYSASTKIITTADEMLEELIRIKR